jgi:hypothetical protein
MRLMGEDFRALWSATVTEDMSGWKRHNNCVGHISSGDLTAMSERSGVSKEIGDALLAYQKALFEDWYQVRWDSESGRISGEGRHSTPGI